MDGRKEKENNVEIGKDISLNREWKWNKTVIKKYLIAISVSDYSQKPIDCTCWSLFVTYNFYIFDPPTLHEVRIPPSNSKTKHLRSLNWKKLPGDRSLRRMNARPVQPIPARSHSHILRPTRGLNSSASVQRVRSPATHMLDCITAHVLDHTLKKN